jgi:hypothetical protein
VNSITKAWKSQIMLFAQAQNATFPYHIFATSEHTVRYWPYHFPLLTTLSTSQHSQIKMEGQVQVEAVVRSARKAERNDPKPSPARDDMVRLFPAIGSELAGAVVSSGSSNTVRASSGPTSLASPEGVAPSSPTDDSDDK